MPPRKRAAAKATTTTATAATTTTVAPKRARRGAKKEEEEEEEEVKEEEEKVEEAVTKDNIIEKLKAADKNDKRPKIRLPDKNIPSYQSYSVYGDYDCMLNQTNIGHNNNKFYVIQVLQSGSAYYCWNRWGRVGEVGQDNGLEYFSDVNDAIKSFEKKFKDKTRNDWKDRAHFKPSPGKYTLIEMDGGGGDDEDDECETAIETKTSAIDPKAYQPSKLDPETQDLISMIFDKDMFKGALKKFDINVKKMPLGKLSKLQIAKGFQVLEEIEAALKEKPVSSAKINDLSSKFYTVIPQDFGRQRPPPINDEETLQKKYDMLIVLSDIELAQTMQANAEKEEKKEKDNSNKPPHPYDVNYDLLKCKLTLVDKKSDEFKVIDKYTKETKGYRGCEIMEVWKVDREDEGKRFKMCDSIDHRKLLWHGTNVAVVVAILKTGLRIMPHSGGRVGRGIYFASENGKSAGYVGTTNHKSKNIGIMFLNEVALGKQHVITRDEPSLTFAPKGCDSVLAKGMTEPDPKFDTHITIDGKKVIVPQGKPTSQNISSSFSQSEYLVYDEGQNRIRYLLKMKF